MSLGQHLASTLDELAAAKKRPSDAYSTAQGEVIRKERYAREILVGEIKGHIRRKIEGGMVPRYKVEEGDLQEWLRKAAHGEAPYQDIYQGLVDWAHEQDLEISVKDQHDGGGMMSWIAVTVTPVTATRDS